MTVRVLGPDGAPFQGAWVNYSPFSNFQAARKQSDEKGLVHYTGMMAREIEIHVFAAHKSREIVAPKAPKVTPEGQEIVVKLVRGVAFSGVVTMPDGTPAVAARIFATSGRRGMGSAFTDANGRFTLYLPPDPDFKFNVSASVQTKEGGYWGAQARDVAAGSGPLELKLKKYR